MKLISKERINAKYYKKYDRPQTPHQRLLTSPDITAETKQKLIVTHALLNPFVLRRIIENKLKTIFNFV
jgi:hypothetical protein